MRYLIGVKLFSGWRVLNKVDTLDEAIKIAKFLVGEYDELGLIYIHDLYANQGTRVNAYGELNWFWLEDVTVNFN